MRLVTLGDGQGRGVRVLEFRTGTGFAFEVLVNRCFDVGRCELSGQPLSWLSGAGVTGALHGTAALSEFEGRVSRLLPAARANSNCADRM